MHNIQQKIIDLFALRKLPLLIEWGGLKSESILAKLEALQKDIYLLDKSLEEHFDINPEQLAFYWERITKHLYDLDYTPAQAQEMLYSLKVYEQGELDIRKNILPHTVRIRPFYYFKSCDVKLLRKIIYDQSSSLKSKIPCVHWILFDFITELIDDIEDEMEDRTIYNGNRFLFSLFYRGVNQTIVEYNGFLYYLKGSLQKMKSILNPEIFKLTEQVYSDANQHLKHFKFNPEPPFILSRKAIKLA